MRIIKILVFLCRSGHAQKSRVSYVSHDTVKPNKYYSKVRDMKLGYTYYAYIIVDMIDPNEDHELFPTFVKKYGRHLKSI